MTQVHGVDNSHSVDLRSPIPLAPAQQWLFDQLPEDPHCFNQGVALRIRDRVEPARLEAALASVAAAHDAFGLRFIPDPSGEWAQTLGSPRLPLTCVNLAHVPHDGEITAIEEQADALHRSLNLGDGPLARALLVELGEHRDPLLLLVAHHLIVDAVSWQILADDLEETYRATAVGGPLTSAPTTGFCAWSVSLRRQTARWIADVDEWTKRVPADADWAAGAPSEATTAVHRLTFDSSVTDALTADRTRSACGPDHVLLAALAEAFESTAGLPGLLIDVEGHGRTDAVGVDAVRTVGWLTATWPLYVRGTGRPLLQVAGEVAAATRSAPHDGRSYGALRHVERMPSLCRLPQARILFTYLGRYRAGPSDALIERVPIPLGTGRTRLLRPMHALTVVGWVDESRLNVDWTESGGPGLNATLDAARTAFSAALNRLATVASPAVPSSPRCAVSMSSTEATVQAAWTVVLGCSPETVGVDDDFFDLGGDSIHMIRIASSLRRTFGVRIPLNAMYEYTTVRLLAAAIDALVATRT